MGLIQSVKALVKLRLNKKEFCQQTVFGLKLQPSPEFPGCQLTLLRFWTRQASTGASQVVLAVKNPPANAGDVKDVGLIPGSRRSPGGGRGNQLQYPCLENPMDIGAWWAAVHRSAELDTTETI